MGIKDTLIELFEERAAIIEFDGNLSRDEAERLAIEELVESNGDWAKAIISKWLRERQ